MKTFRFELGVFTLSAVLLLPEQAFAYLDPGTGNALVYGLISLASVGAYAMKSAFYWLIRKKNHEQPSSATQAEGLPSLLIYSEGKNYWGTFRPIVETLIERKILFRYWTQDIHDPALLIDSEYMDSRYIGNGSRSWFKLNSAQADIMLATTPNIGTPGYPMIRSPKVGRLIHVWHSIGDFAYAWYHKGGLDSYDEVLTAGTYMDAQIRLLEQKRGLPEKKLTPCGVPYLDGMVASVREASDEAPAPDGKTILVAPSWGNKGCLNVYGVNFIADLARAGFSVIVRPHPQSLKVEKALFDSFKEQLAAFPSVSWDEGVDGSASMRKAALLISDTSSVRMDFALLYERPVITLEMPLADLSEYEYDELKPLLEQSSMELEIGSRAGKADISRMPEVVQATLSAHSSRDFAAIRNKYVAHFGRSGEAVAVYLITQLAK